MPTLRSIIILSCVCLISEATADNLDQNRKCFDGNSTLATPGWTIPRGDIVLEVVQPLEIYCMLHSTNNLTENYTADDIVFRRGNTKIDSQYVTVVNATAARLYMQNLNITTETEYIYCNLNLRGNDIATLAPSANTSSLEMPSTTEQMICSNALTIGCKPQDLYNITCIDKYFTPINCTWIEPNNGVETFYNVTLRNPYNKKGKPYGSTYPQSFQCNITKKGACDVWSYFDFQAANKPHYQFYVQKSNMFGTGVQDVKVEHWANLIAYPLGNLTFNSSTTHSIHLTYHLRRQSYNDLQRYIDFKDVISKLTYRVNCTMINSGSWSINEYNYSQYEEAPWRDRWRGITINKTNLYANTDYSFTISAKAWFNHSLWSEPTQLLVVRTNSCAPYHPPDTDIGSFEILEVSSQSQSRDVLIYWKPLRNVEYNGNNFKYEFAVFKDNIKVNIKPDKIDKTYAQFNNLSFSSSYRFVIKSTNDNGSAPYTSEVKLPRQEDISSDPSPTLFTKVDFGDGVYQLSWRVPSPTETNKKISNYTVFWCENYQGYPYHCSDSLNWTHLSADTFKYRHNFSTTPSKAYQFAISVNSINSSSGMMWALCTVLHNRVNKIRNTWIGESGSHYVELRWKLDCDERAEGIKGYNISYCSTSVDGLCNEPLQTCLIYGDVTTEHGNVTGLTPFTAYKFSMAIFTDEVLGAPSEWISRTTKDAAPTVTDIKVQVTNITDSTAIVKWTPPANSNGILDHYEVYYEADKKVIVNETFVELTGLRSYDIYYIQVVACTKLCSRTNPIAFHTKIGAPNEVKNILAENVNNTDIKLKWQPPSIPSGPNPLYDVKIQFNEPETSSDFREFETNETEKMIEIPCNEEPYHSAYTFFIRAKNIDNSDLNDVKHYYGPWSSAYTIDCVNNGRLPTVLKSMLIFLLCTLCLSVFAFLSKKTFYKFQQMKNIEVNLPAKFTVSPVCRNEIKDIANQVNTQPCTDPNKIDQPNKLSDADQSNIDCINKDLDADREISQSIVVDAITS